MKKQKNKKFITLRNCCLAGLYCLCGLLVSCSGSVIDKPDPDEPTLKDIGFKILEDRTRAQSATKNNLKNISVFGYYMGEVDWADWNEGVDLDLIADYFCNLVLEKENSWSYTPPRYWPEIPNQISFFAYSPYVVTADAEGQPADLSGSALIPYPALPTQKGKPTVAYNVPNDIMDQVDLLWSSSLDRTETTAKVDFRMKHALTQITFAAELVDDGSDKEDYTAIIDKISISGVFEKGTLNLENGSWTIDYTDELETDEIYILEDELENGTLTSSAPEVDNCLSAEAGSLMLLPQELDENATLKIFLTFLNKDNDPVKESTVTASLLDLGETWEPNKSITYKLLISEEYITINASTASWQTGYGYGEIDL